MKKQFFLISMLFLINITNTFGIVASREINAEDCAQIVMKNGDIIQADIIQITPTDIKYKRCGKPNDPEMVLYKKDVLSIKGTDGDIIYRNDNKGNETSEVKTEGLAIAGFILSILGLFTGIAAIVGIILSAIGLSKIQKNPKKLKGRGLAIAGLIIGIILLLIILSAA